MKKNENTGLGLIKTTIERVQNERSLFGSALKKLVNSSEEELKDFLERKIEKKNSNILRLIPGAESPVLKASDGSRLIYQATETFKSGIDQDFENWGLTKKGVAMPETKVQVHEMVSDANFLDIFGSLPGDWNQKFLTQNQIIDFCEQLPGWLKSGGSATIFLCKIDETGQINEKKPQSNLVAVRVHVRSGVLAVHVNRLENGNAWYAKYSPHIVVPQLILKS